jgi:transcriptional regulator with XRE-family HTH domain
MSTEKEKLGKRIRDAREDRGISQADLAREADIHPTVISQFESGSRQPSPDNLKKLADALSVSIDYLLGREETKGTSVEAIFRHADGLSKDELDELENYAEYLAKKNEDE